ncbi:unnamed protein product, partial [marine sediment metagenome]
MGKKTPNFHSTRFIQKYLDSIYRSNSLTTFFRMGYDGQCYA